jgi:antitoxin HicB
MIAGLARKPTAGEPTRAVKIARPDLYVRRSDVALSTSRPMIPNMNRTYTILLEPDPDGGFIVSVPALPEVGTQGETRDEARANAREAIELVIEHRLARGESVPADITPEIEQVTVAA